MKLQTSNFKLQTSLITLLFAILLNVPLAKAQQPFGIPYYTNCYQSVAGGTNGGTQIFRFLNTTSGRTIKLTCSNPLDINVFEVYAKEYGSNDYYFLTSGDGTLSISNIFESIQILPIGTSSAFNYATTQIDFVDFDFQINSNSGTPPCLTFDNLNINATHNLDGLCRTPQITLKMPPGTINTWGLGANFSLNLTENQGYQIPIQNFCEENNCLDGLGNPVGCCITFDFEFTLLPCIGNEMDCPNLTYTKSFNVCCFCGTGGGSNN